LLRVWPNRSKYVTWVVQDLAECKRERDEWHLGHFEELEFELAVELGEELQHLGLHGLEPALDCARAKGGCACQSA
jgi:hypothetical protein